MWEFHVIAWYQWEIASCFHLQCRFWCITSLLCMATWKRIMNRAAALVVTSSLVCLFLRDAIVIVLSILLQWPRMKERHKPQAHMLIFTVRRQCFCWTPPVLLWWGALSRSSLGELLPYDFCVSLPDYCAFCCGTCLSQSDIRNLNFYTSFCRGLWKHVLRITSPSLGAYNSSCVHYSIR